MTQITISWLLPILQILIAFGLLNVWLVRSGRATKYRGSGAQNIKEEFAVYGLPVWFMYTVGFLKISIAIILLISLFVSGLLATVGLGALLILAILMLGAISMHIKVKDPFIKTLPAIIMFVMSVLAVYMIV